MNIYTPTGKKLLSYPQWVDQLIKENQKLLEKIRIYEERESTERGTGDGQKDTESITDGCPICRFVDEGIKSDRLHSGRGARIEECDPEETGE